MNAPVSRPIRTGVGSGRSWAIARTISCTRIAIACSSKRTRCVSTLPLVRNASLVYFVFLVCSVYFVRDQIDQTDQIG